jgi:glutamate/tyrosine decarboxylase-like PLP-dependent enzyme
VREQAGKAQGEESQVSPVWRGWALPEELRGEAMSLLCGHDRETLLWALRHEHRCGGLGGFDAVHRGDAHCTAWRAIHDQAKLVEFMAEELKRRGWMYHREQAEIGKTPLFTYHVGNKIWFTVWLTQLEQGDIHESYTLTEFRAALMRALESPEDVTSEDLLHALESP